MSCCTTSSSSECDPANESLASSLTNFENAFFGALTKTCVNNQVVWTLPCDLTTGNSSFPRLSGEGIACYFQRFIASFLAAQEFAIGMKGFRTRALAATSVVLFRNIDVINQDFTGILTGPVTITLDSNGAINGDEFYLSFTNLVVGAVNNLSINSDASLLLNINTAGTLNGYLKAVYTGTAWKLTLTSVNLT